MLTDPSSASIQQAREDCADHVSYIEKYLNYPSIKSPTHKDRKGSLAKSQEGIFTNKIIHSKNIKTPLGHNDSMISSVALQTIVDASMTPSNTQISFARASTAANFLPSGSEASNRMSRAKKQEQEPGPVHMRMHLSRVPNDIASP